MQHRVCKKCGNKVSKNCRLGYCNACRDRSGVNNPFYGKKHSAETISTLTALCREGSLLKWTEPVYRDRVIKAVSKPRREGFKSEQSVRIKKWYKDNPGQKESRRVTMTERWKTGAIVPNKYVGSNYSKIEETFFNKLKELYPFFKRKVTLKNEQGTWFFPDALADDYVVIEFFGNFWHANPEMFSADEIVHHGLTAKDIWNRDLKRRRALESFEIRKGQQFGYTVITVWEKEFKEDPDGVLSSLDQHFNWDSCAM